MTRRTPFIAVIAALALAAPVASAEPTSGKHDDGPGRSEQAPGQNKPAEQQSAAPAAPAQQQQQRPAPSQQAKPAPAQSQRPQSTPAPAQQAPAKPRPAHPHGGAPGQAAKPRPQQSAPAAAPAQRPANSHAKAGKTTICHATGSATNPYVTITISDNALPAHARHQDGRDLIPAPAGGCPSEAAPAEKRSAQAQRAAGSKRGLAAAAGERAAGGVLGTTHTAAELADAGGVLGEIYRGAALGDESEHRAGRRVRGGRGGRGDIRCGLGLGRGGVDAAGLTLGGATRRSRGLRAAAGGSGDEVTAVLVTRVSGQRVVGDRDRHVRVRGRARGVADGGLPGLGVRVDLRRGGLRRAGGPGRGRRGPRRPRRLRGALRTPLRRGGVLRLRGLALGLRVPGRRRLGVVAGVLRRGAVRLARPGVALLVTLRLPVARVRQRRGVGDARHHNHGGERRRDLASHP